MYILNQCHQFQCQCHKAPFERGLSAMRFVQEEPPSVYELNLKGKAIIKVCRTQSCVSQLPPGPRHRLNLEVSFKPYGHM